MSEGLKTIALSLFLISSLLNASHRIIPELELSERLKFYQKIKTLHTDFHQVKSIKSIGMELKSEGEMRLELPGKVVWTIKKPSFSKVELEGNTIKMTSGQGAEQKTQTMVLGKETDPNVSKAILSMMAWMRMDVPEIEKSYVISELGKNEFRCEPKNPAVSVFAALNFKLHPKGHVEELKIEEKSGDLIQIEFDKPQIKLVP